MKITPKTKVRLPTAPVLKPPATLEDALAYLGLNRISELWKTACMRAANEEIGYEAFLKDLVIEEARLAWEKTVQHRIRQARFPVIKTIDTFDFAHPKKCNRQMVMGWLDLGFVERKENLVLVGPSGVGKSHLATAVAHHACMAGISTRFALAIDVVNELRAAHKSGNFAYRLGQYVRPRILVLDELGYLPIEKGGADLLFQIISKRYESGSIVLTSNLGFKDWDQVFGTATTASAVLDRLLHHAQILKVEGESYRLKERKARERDTEE